MGALVGQTEVRDHQNETENHRNGAHNVGHPETLIQCSLAVKVVLSRTGNTAIIAAGRRVLHAWFLREERRRAMYRLVGRRCCRQGLDHVASAIGLEKNAGRRHHLERRGDGSITVGDQLGFSYGLEDWRALSDNLLACRFASESYIRRTG